MKEMPFRIYTSKSKAKIPYYFITHMALTAMRRRLLYGDPTCGHSL